MNRAVLDGSGSYEWFDVKTGVKQGCCISFVLFFLCFKLIIIHYHAPKTKEE